MILSFSSALSIFISAYAFIKSRKIPAAKMFSLMMLSTAFYCQIYAIEINATEVDIILNLMKFEGFWAGFTAPAYFLFIVQFTRRNKLNKWLLIFTMLLPIFFGISYLSLESHKLIYSSYKIVLDKMFPVIQYEPGILYIANAIFLIGIASVAQILLIIHIFKSRGVIRRQSLIILIAGFIPTLFAILFPVKSPTTLINYQPFSIVISGICTGIALFRYQILDLASIARWLAVDNISEYMIILDKDMVIIDINNSGKKSDILNGINIGSTLPLEKEPYKTIESSRFFNNFKVDNINSRFEYKKRHYKMNCTHVFNSRGKFAGDVIIINDDTKMISLMKELEIKAIFDGLTGIYNRRHFMNLASREISIAKRNNQVLSVIMFDIDHFKKINDKYGHLKGDEVLVTLVTDIKKQLRPSDIFGRYGGEEFCLFLQATGMEEAKNISERLRESVSSLLFKSENDDVFKVTISLGIYTSNKDDRRINSLIGNADKALYIAKKEGRNRTVVF